MFYLFIYLFIFDCWWGWGSIHTLPVVRLISMARWRWPRTLNWGRETSLLTPTLFGPSFHLYRMSLIVYPTEKIERPPAVGTYLRGSPQTRFSSEGASTYLAPPSKPQQVRSLYFPLFLIIHTCLFNFFFFFSFSLFVMCFLLRVRVRSLVVSLLIVPFFSVCFILCSLYLSVPLHSFLIFAFLTRESPFNRGR